MNQEKQVIGLLKLLVLIFISFLIISLIWGLYYKKNPPITNYVLPPDYTIFDIYHPEKFEYKKEVFDKYNAVYATYYREDIEEYINKQKGVFSFLKLTDSNTKYIGSEKEIEGDIKRFNVRKVDESQNNLSYVYCFFYNNNFLLATRRGDVYLIGGIEGEDIYLNSDFFELSNVFLTNEELGVAAEYFFSCIKSSCILSYNDKTRMETKIRLHSDNMRRIYDSLYPPDYGDDD